MADLAKLVDELSNLSVLEAAELSKLLEGKVGRLRCCARSRGRRAAGAADAGGAAAEAKTEFDVVWPKRAPEVNVIKEVAPSPDWA